MFAGMTRWLPILCLFFAACQGTLDLDDGSVQDGSAGLTAAAAVQPAADAPADAAPPPATSTPTPTDTTPVDEPPPTTDPVPPEPEPEPEPEEPALPEPGSTVEFTIAQGTGTGAWNTPETAVVVYVGQVLRLTNFDDRDHHMHAANDAAVDHGGNLRPGQSEDHVVVSAMPVGTEARLWDHNDGRDAAFWVEAREYPTP